METAGCPELPDASRRDAREVIEGLRVCARWDMWGDTSSPRRGVGAPEEQGAKAGEKFSGPAGSQGPGAGPGKGLLRRGEGQGRAGGYVRE